MAIYVKIDGLTGPVTTKGYSGYFELTSFEMGADRALTQGTGGKQVEGTVVELSPITITKTLDQSSAKLFEQSITGQNIKTMVFEFTTTTKGGVSTYLTYALGEALFKSYKATSTGDIPVEVISIIFHTVTIKTSFLTDKGTPDSPTITGWDVTKNKVL